jgi:hypothetical protein
MMMHFEIFGDKSQGAKYRRRDFIDQSAILGKENNACSYKIYGHDIT